MSLKVAYIGNSTDTSTGAFTYLSVLRSSAPKSIEAVFLDRYNDSIYDIVHFTDIKHTNLREVRRAAEKSSIVVDIHDYSFLEYVPIPSVDAPVRWYLHRKRKKAYAPVLEAADVVVCHSRYMSRLLPGSHLVYIGIPGGRCSGAPLEGRDGLLFVGRDYYQKGLDVVMRAMRLLHREGLMPHLTVIGREYVHSRAIFSLKSAGLNVTFLDAAPQSEIMAMYMKSRIFLRPSYLEGFGLSILEALCCGTPVVATSVGGIPEIVSDGVSGYLIEPGNHIALADRIKSLLADDDIWKRMSEAGRKTASKYTIEGMWRSLMDAYEAALNAPEASFTFPASL